MEKHLSYTWPRPQRSYRANYLYLHQRVTLTVPLASLLLCQFLLCCDFRHRQAPAGIGLLWFVADDGTILTWQLAASNHSNKKGGELSGSWAQSQVMSSLALTTSPSSLAHSSLCPVTTMCYYCIFIFFLHSKERIKKMCAHVKIITKCCLLLVYQWNQQYSIKYVHFVHWDSFVLQ